MKRFALESGATKDLISSLGPVDLFVIEHGEGRAVRFQKMRLSRNLDAFSAYARVLMRSPEVNNSPTLAKAAEDLAKEVQLARYSIRNMGKRPVWTDYETICRTAEAICRSLDPGLIDQLLFVM